MKLIKIEVQKLRISDRFMWGNCCHIDCIRQLDNKITVYYSELFEVDARPCEVYIHHGFAKFNVDDFVQVLVSDGDNRIEG